MTNRVNKINRKTEKAREKVSGKTRQRKLIKGTHDVLDGSFLREGNLTKKICFILFLAVIGLLYIANNHFAEKKIREIDRIRLVNKELSFDYLSMKTRLNEKKRASYLAEKLKKYGIEPSVEPPEKITLNP